MVVRGEGGHIDNLRDETEERPLEGITNSLGGSREGWSSGCSLKHEARGQNVQLQPPLTPWDLLRR